MVQRSLQGQVAVVTGGSRGIGKGIACELGRAGATVYITGRTRGNERARWPGSINQTAEDVTRLGGEGIALACDHRNDAEVEAAFQRIVQDRARLDILVNNASAFGDTADGYPLDDVPFWDVPVALWDEMHTVGLRSHYVAASIAAPTMIAARCGLIVNISSAGAACYVFNAAYGAAKGALDKLTADMAHDLRGRGVAVISLWPPFTRTEKYLAQNGKVDLSRARSPEFTGRTVVALATDSRVLEWSGQALRVTELAAQYSIAD